ncbi:MAG: family 10 glycosylhydrolase [Chitinophagaceae bacterium]|nr:family 10 glycosylhydrolase [Chitinophagaceae bacterium]
MLCQKIKFGKAGTFFLTLIFLSALVLSCKKPTEVTYTPPPPEDRPPVWDVNALRGVWVTTTASTALNSRANIKEMVTNCKAAGINTIFMVVYNNARTMYPSTVMNNLIGKPILETFTGRDPLQECIEEAHAQGLKVHAWFEYGFASSFSANGGAIVAAKPHWAAKDVSGNLVVKNGFDWLNGIHPEVQQFMIDLFKEVVTKYNVDGVQGDDRLPAMPTQGGYDTYTVDLYKAENGGASPPTNFANTGWVNWRANKLNQFCKRLRNEVKAIKPTVQFTISPSPFPFGMNEYLQDWPTWVDSAWVDAILPQCYRYDISAYNATLAQQKGYYKNNAVPFYPGVLLKVGSYVASDAFLTQMIQSNRAAGFKGECFFFYEGIKESPGWFRNQYPYIP